MYHDETHVLLIVAIKQLQAQNLSLSDIQEKLVGLPMSKLKAIGGTIRAYWLTKPINLPKGGTVFCEAIYDNSVNHQTAKLWYPAPKRVPDAARSLGHLTERLADYAPQIFAFDIAEKAVQRTRDRCAALNSNSEFKIQRGDLNRPPYPPGCFDVVFLGDVVCNLLNTEDRHLAICKMLSMLSDNGILVMTECMKCTHQNAYVSLVEKEGGWVQEEIYYHDRYWNKFRRLVKRLGSRHLIQVLMGSKAIHYWLSKLTMIRGPGGSKHIGLVVKRLPHRAFSYVQDKFGDYSQHEHDDYDAQRN